MGNTINHPPEPIHTSDTQAMLTFMGVLAHEIRSQIAAICTTSDIMRDNQKMKENEQIEHLSIISSASYYALHILDNMMDAAKFSKGKLELKPLYSRFHFRDWLKLLIQQFDLVIDVASVKIHVNVDSNVPEYIITDQVKLGQILYNLLSNAVKSTRQHTSIKLNVSLRSDSQLSFQVNSVPLN